MHFSLTTLYHTWKKNNTARLGSALSFHAMLAIPPLLISGFAVIHFFLDSATTREKLTDTISTIASPAAASALGDVINRLPELNIGSVTGILSMGFFLIIAASWFGHLKRTLHDLWYISTNKQKLIVRAIHNRLPGIIILIILSGLMLAGTLFDSLFAVANTAFDLSTVLPLGILQVSSVLLSTLLIFLFFSAILYLLPESNLRYHDALLGGIITGILFLIGKFGITTYLAHTNLVSWYGATGSFILLLIWIYYSIQIFLIGATLLYVYTKEQGRPILSRNAGIVEKVRKKLSS